MKRVIAALMIVALLVPCVCLSAQVAVAPAADPQDPTATLRGCSLFYHDPRFMGGPEGWVEFPSGNPEAAQFVSEYLNQYSGFKSGEFYDGVIYAYRYDSNSDYAFCAVDAFTFEETVLNIGPAIPEDLAYDYSTNTMYAASEGTLNVVSLTDGTLTLVGEIGPESVLALACSTDGQLYAIGSDGGFYTVDKQTGAGTLVGNTGVTADNYQSMAYDHNTGKLYWASCSTTPLLLSYYTTDSALYEVNVNDGSVNRISGTIYDARMQVTCLHIIPDFYESEQVEAESMTLSLYDAYFLVGQTAQLNAYVEPSNAPKGVTWSIEDESVATVGNGGFVTAIAVGETVVTATSLDGRVSQTCTIHVITEEQLAEFTLADALDDGGFGGTVVNSTTYPYSVDIREGRICAKTNMHQSQTYTLLQYNFGYLTAGTVVKFDWKTDTMYFCHGLILYVNVPYTANLTGSSAWFTYEYVIPEDGEYIFTWSFWRDSSEPAGEDTCFVDNIRVEVPQDELVGDVDGNGAVEVADAVLALRHAMQISVLSDEQFARADIDGDGVVSAADATRILRIAMQL